MWKKNFIGVQNQLVQCQIKMTADAITQRYIPDIHSILKFS